MDWIKTVAIAFSVISVTRCRLETAAVIEGSDSRGNRFGSRLLIRKIQPVRFLYFVPASFRAKFM
jgi:hypothetical protein